MHRRTWVPILLVVASVLALVGAFATWVDRQVLDTDNWVATADELLADDRIQEALAAFIVNELYTSVDVQQAVEQVLPDDLQGLSGPLAAGLREPATRTVDGLLGTGPVEELWGAANRGAHEALVAILEDDAEAVSASGGVVSLQLGELVRQLGEALGLPAGVLDRIPADAGTIEIVRSDELATAQRIVQVVRVLSVWSIILAVVLYALAVYLAEGRRRLALRNVGWSLVAVGIVLLAGRRIGLRWVLSMVENAANEDAAREAVLIGSRLLAQIGWAAVAYGVVLLLGAVYAGPSRWAVRLRKTVAPFVNAEAWMVWAVAGVVFLVLVVWSPTPAFDAWWSALLLLVLFVAGVHALRQQSVREFPSAGAGPSPAPVGAGPQGEAGEADG